MKTYLITMIVLYGISILAKTINITTKSFPYKETKTIKTTVLELITSIGLCVWVLSLLEWI